MTVQLPADMHPVDAVPALLDYGMTLSSPLGTADLRVDRPGSRFRIALQFPPMVPERSRIIVSRLLRAKAEGLRVPYPLFVSQGLPNAPVVDGAGQAGTTLAVRGLTPNYSFREGWWLSIESATGQHFLHNVAAGGIASSGGSAQLSIWPPLRRPFADGDKVHLGKPMIEGLPEGDETSWQIPVNGLVAVAVTIREQA
ncbi:hypothetical protein [Novosphingopyxis sp. YJ-S2-01]|uniref:hypothetical protein n=1 Tax=Novosphingopyxis sp. YJ-S2-01 TaxID=2794021 RepID=UPI0018DBA06C|nr:hypothetical protein [Novosphingopyxis sp. YJ-S2-01]MBH9537531.1 hypothetical protein [Novosphingopyxis sp. YJ-S2-01]